MKTFDPDDPMLTTYALGEFEGDVLLASRMREIEALLARDPAAARQVEAIRAAASSFRHAFEEEPTPAVKPIRAIEIEPRRRRGPIIPFLFYATTAAAACFFFVIVVRLGDPARQAAHSAGQQNAAESVLPTTDKQEMEGAAAGSDDARALGRVRAPAAAPAHSVRAAELERPAESQMFRATGERGDRERYEPAPPPPEKPKDDWPDKGVVDLRELESDLAAKKARVGDETGPKQPRLAGGALMESDRVSRKIDTGALLAELGFAGAKIEHDGAADQLDSHLSHGVSPEPDPEAALVRAVEGFARLIEAGTPATDEAWDHVLADARYAAGSDQRRLDFVETIEQARRVAPEPAR